MGADRPMVVYLFKQAVENYVLTHTFIPAATNAFAFPALPLGLFNMVQLGFPDIALDAHWEAAWQHQPPAEKVAKQVLGLGML